MRRRWVRTCHARRQHQLRRSVAYAQRHEDHTTLMTANWDRQAGRQTGRSRPGAATNEPTTTTRNIDRSNGCTRDRRPPSRVNARVRDNYYQTGCVARPTDRTYKSVDACAAPVHPAAAVPIHLDRDETRRVVRPSVKATTSATCISCGSCSGSI